MNRENPGRDLRLALLAAAVAVLAVLLYIPALDGEFLNWDDEWLVVENPHLDEVRDLRWILDPTAWRAGLGAEYLPVRDLSFWVDRHLFGLAPFGYHLENAILYGLVCALSVWVLKALTGSRAAAAIAALLFAVHPLHVESVAWVSERKGLLAAAFLLSSFLAYRRARVRGSPAWFAGAVGLFVLAAASKSTVHFFPVLLPALEWIEARRAGRPRRILRWGLCALPFLAVSVAAIALNFRHQFEAGAAYGWEAGAVGSTAFCYVRMFLVPVGLSAEYGPAAGGAAWPAAAALLALIGLVGFAVRRGHVAAPSALFVLLAWLPVSNLIALPNPMADRYTFLPSLGAAGLLGLALAAGLRRGRAIRTAAGVALVVATGAFAMLSIQRMGAWSDSESLWTDAVEKAPGSARARQNLGAALLRRGDSGAAFAQFDRMLEVEPDEGDWYVFVAAQYEAAGASARAERILRKGCAAAPDHPGPRINLASLLLGHASGGVAAPVLLEEADSLLRGVIEANDLSPRFRPYRAVAALNLGTLELSRGRIPPGIDLLQRALALGLSPADRILAHENLARALRLTGAAEEAAEHERQAREIAGRLGLEPR